MDGQQGTFVPWLIKPTVQSFFECHPKQVWKACHLRSKLSHGRKNIKTGCWQQARALSVLKTRHVSNSMLRPLLWFVPYHFWFVLYSMANVLFSSECDAGEFADWRGQHAVVRCRRNSRIIRIQFAVRARNVAATRLVLLAGYLNWLCRLFHHLMAAYGWRVLGSIPAANSPISRKDF